MLNDLPRHRSDQGARPQRSRVFGDAKSKREHGQEKTTKEGSGCTESKAGAHQFRFSWDSRMMTIKRPHQVLARRLAGVTTIDPHTMVRLIAVVLLAVCIVACGGSSTRHLLSISISPPSANGANFPLGAVQFTATGTFDKVPVTVTSPTATWSISPSGIASIGTSDGFAQCASTGTATITASAPVTQGSSTMVSGTATLTCP